ncbi:MAG: transposase family protein [Planctomycetota bacterium]|nr:transposase family protein [Planctomycetota bacterium]
MVLRRSVWILAGIHERPSWRTWIPTLCSRWRSVWSSPGTVEDQRLDLQIAYRDSAHFPCPCCAESNCPVHDCTEKRWRHLDFFQHQAFLTARVPRVRCPNCGVKQVAVPWARPGSGFTLLMEALILEMAKHMPIRAVARILRVRDTRLWRVVTHYVTEAVARIDLKDLRQVAIDETSARKRHDYISMFFDLNSRRLVFACKGRSSSVLGEFADFMCSHAGDPKRVRQDHLIAHAHRQALP